MLINMSKTLHWQGPAPGSVYEPCPSLPASVDRDDCGISTEVIRCEGGGGFSLELSVVLS